MEARDLMIGDWVQVPVEFNRYKKIMSTYDIDDAPLYKPISLTPEILKKNGLEKAKYFKSMYWSYNTDEHVKVDVSSDGDNFIEVRGEKGQYNGYCKFIHDFQHALRLCGIEKEIIL